MTKEEALKETLEALGVSDTSDIALAAEHPQEPNRFRYVSKLKRQVTLFGGRNYESYEEGPVVVEVVVPDDRESDGWQVHRL